MNTILLASQIAWPLQAVIAITFAGPLLGLAWQLQRPAARALAMGWVWTTLVMLVTSLGTVLVQPAQARPGSVIVALIGSGIGGSVPAYAAAIDALVAERPIHPLRAVLGRSLRWAAMLLIALLIAGALESGPLSAAAPFVVNVGRVVLVVAYVWLAVHAMRSRGVAVSRFRKVLLVFALALLVQAMRPFTAVLFFQGASSSPLSDPRAMAFLMVNVFITTAFGLACIFMAIEEERTAVDATSRQLRDAALRVERAQRMESVGRLATGVAHDFNNFLMVIKAGAEMAHDRFRDGEAPVEEMQAIDDAAERGIALTRQLVTFARQQQQQRVVFDAVDRVRHMQDLLERMVGRQLTLTTKLPPRELCVHMDPTQFEQVLINLVSNSRNAVSDTEGRITLQLEPASVDDGQFVEPGALASGSYLCMRVTDNGRGIPTDALSHIFEPFFTTRSEEGGTGLGLATVQGIVRQSGGEVAVQSTLGVGSTFTVWLPAEAPTIA